MNEELLKLITQLQSDVIHQMVEDIGKEVDQQIELGEQLIEKYAPLVAKYVKKFCKFQTELDVITFKEYTKAGMTSGEAVGLIQSRLHNQAMILRDSLKK